MTFENNCWNKIIKLRSFVGEALGYYVYHYYQHRFDSFDTSFKHLYFSEKVERVRKLAHS
jgi:hypothetical protein